jgi:hypothetical protein
MSYNKTVNDFQFRWIQGLINPWNMIFTSDVSVNIMFHRLINPCIHLIESHQLYNIFVHYSVSEIATLILSMSLNFIKAWRNDKWYNKRVLIWHFTLVLIKINYGQIGDQTGIFYTINPVFYTGHQCFSGPNWFLPDLFVGPACLRISVALWFDSTRTWIHHLPHLRRTCLPLNHRCRSYKILNLLMKYENIID